MCTDLTSLDLSTNRFTGNTTCLFDGCARLEYVDLSSNNFTGELWPGIARFRQLKAAESKLTGIVPTSTFPNSWRLTYLDLSANGLIGEFPDSVTNCNNLTYMSLWGNNFTGTIPVGIGKLAVLEMLILGNNRFDRQIPPELTNCRELRFLDISSNCLEGRVLPLPLPFLMLPPCAQLWSAYAECLIQVQRGDRPELAARTKIGSRRRPEVMRFGNFSFPARCGARGLGRCI
jgi:Leucine-rich repeat (LRR) protein